MIVKDPCHLIKLIAASLCLHTLPITFVKESLNAKRVESRRTVNSVALYYCRD